MKNHIKAKFVGFTFSKIPLQKFIEVMADLTEELRPIFPTHELKDIQTVVINYDTKTQSQSQEVTTEAKELFMVDADGNIGFKLSNQGLAISTNEYVSYEDLIETMQVIIGACVEKLKITHFSDLYLRNINLFKTEDNKSDFKDIQNKEYWGSQSFSTLAKDYSCQGASTRHEYFSNDYMNKIQLVSGVILPKQNLSYIPQNNWDIWMLRGGIPTIDELHLVIDIIVQRFQAPANLAKEQSKVTKYSWTALRAEFDTIHSIINNVYSDITVKD